jgi:tetratricopeptide (TPR) repeat protein
MEQRRRVRRWPGGRGDAGAETETLYREGHTLLDGYAGEGADLQRAYELFSAIAAEDPRSPYALVGVGRVIYKAGYISRDNYHEASLEKAKALFTEAMSIDPEFFDAYYYGAYPHIYSGDHGTARRLIDEAQALRPDSVEVHLAYGALAKAMGDDNEVVRRAELALAKSRNMKHQVDAHTLLKGAYKRQRRFDLAEREYLKLLRLQPESPWAMINYSDFLRWHVKDYDRAIQYGERSLAVMDFGMGHHVLGKAYYEKGRQLLWGEKRQRESRRYFQQAIEHMPGNSDAYYGLGTAYYHTAHADKSEEDIVMAERALERALELEPGHPQATSLLARVRKVIGALESR